MQLDCTFSITPRIVLSDKNLSSTEKLLMGLIVSLTLKITIVLLVISILQIT